MFEFISFKIFFSLIFYSHKFCESGAKLFLVPLAQVFAIKLTLCHILP